MRFLAFLRGVLGLALVAGGARAQAPAWRAAVAGGSATGDYSSVSATATDDAGNVYLAGNFAGTVSFGPFALTNASADGLRDAFVAKWSPATGAFLWARRAGGPGNDAATALAVSGSHVYAAGSFGGPTATFGPLTLANADPSGATRDVFVAELAADTGAFAWAQPAGGPADDYATALAAAGPLVYVAGGFGSATAAFGGTALARAGSSGADAFVAALVAGGPGAAFRWAQRAGGPGDDVATALAVRGASVYVAGRFASATAAFGPAALANANPNGSHDVFVAKLTDAGPSAAFTWAQRAGGAGDDRANALAVSGASVYVAGEFQGPTASFGGTVLANTTTDNLYYDVFIAKLTDAEPSGAFAWARRAGGPGDDYANALAVRGADVYVAGSFAGNVLGNAAATFGGTTFTTAGLIDLYVAKLTDAGPSGAFAWATRAGGPGYDYATAVALASTGVYVAGDFASPTAGFGPLALANPNSAATAYLAALADGTALATSAPAPRAGMAAYPNPARARATVQVPAVPGAAQATLALLDARGRVLRTWAVPLPTAGTSAEVALDGLAPGLYQVQVQAGGWRAVQPLVVQ
ncbi:T9SS type A sorting domain-containing protein [Hymenobacter sp. PAMC 26628]|uniref:T9SS type A sorting domain-containing protein n=1 Tax=Hymenobacter sp. PAMC 26628 TaxID=1484118 RepID=UPI0012FFBC33|nr:T9SS type A sorting domain-containing protein [Hymenobacter sp. PAMC 26628]